MIKVKFDTCVECAKEGDERDKPMANNSLKLCQYHNNKRKRESKKSMRTAPKSQGYLAMYKEIWRERPHRSEISGIAIKQFDLRCFMHVLNKNRFKDLSLNKRSVFLVLPEEHEHYDNVGRKDLENDPMWKRVFDRRIELLRESYGVKT